MTKKIRVTPSTALSEVLNEASVEPILLEDDGQLYHWPVVGIGLVVAVAILVWFHRLPYARTPEESLQEAIEHQTAQWIPS